MNLTTCYLVRSRKLYYDEFQVKLKEVVVNERVIEQRTN